MQITVLGSGTGVPSLERNAAGVLIQIEKENLLFDTGPGIVRKLLEAGITYHDIQSIFYSHFHTDHTLDLAVFLFAAKYALSLRTKKLDIIASAGITDFYEKLLNLYGDVIRPDSYSVNLRQIGEEELEFEHYRIKTQRMEHTAESLGYRIEAGGKSVVYSGDTDVCDNIIRLGQDADVLILDCSFPNEMKVKGHLTPEEAGRVARAAGCSSLVLSHLYPVCDKQTIGEQAKKTFKGKVLVASDLMKISL